MQGGEEPGEHHDTRVEEVHRVAHGDSEQVEGLRHQRGNHRIGAVREHRGELVRLGGLEPDGIQQALLGDLGLQAAVRATVTDRPAGPHEGVSDLPGIPGSSGEQLSAGQHATADAAGAADDVDEVLHIAHGPEGAFGAHGQHGGIRGPGRVPRRMLEHRRKRLLQPAQVRRLTQLTVGQPHLARNRDTQADHRERAILRCEHLVDRGARQLHHLFRRGQVSRLDPHVGQDPTAEADQAHVNGVDLRVHRDGNGTFVEVHHRARPAGPGDLLGHPLADQPPLGQVGDHGADRRTVQAGHPGQLSTRQGSAAMKQPQDLREIVAAQLVCGGHGSDATLRGPGDGRHVRTPNRCGGERAGPPRGS